MNYNPPSIKDTSNKSYVTLERRICLACGSAFDTGALLMDRRLTQRFDHHTTTGYGLCHKHTIPGFVTLIEADRTKSRAANDATTARAEDVYRTGRVMYIREEVFPQIMNGVPAGALAVFIDIDAFNKITKEYGDIAKELTVDDVAEIAKEAAKEAAKETNDAED